MSANQASSSSRYPSLTNRSSSFSNGHPTCSSSDHKVSRKHLYHLNRLTGNSIGSSNSPDGRSNSSRFTQILAKTKANSPSSPKTKNEQNFGIMVKKFMEKRVKPKPEPFTNSEDLKKTGPKVLSITKLNRKLFPNGKTDGKALTNVKSNPRTLSLVLKSERDLLNQNKEYEVEIAELRWLLEEKNKEVEKLKSTCLKQMEQIQALKGAILFPDEIDSKFKKFSEDQGSELLQDKQANPIPSLRDHLRCLAVDPAEDFSSCGLMDLESSDGLYLKDLNPYLTLHSILAKSKSKSKEPQEPKRCDDYKLEDGMFNSGIQLSKCSSWHGRKSSGSSDYD